MNSISLIEKSIEFARIAHAGQKRKNGEDFINHPLRVMEYLQNIGIKDETTLSAAVLHAVISEGKISISEIENYLGKDIAFLVKILNSTPEIHNPIEKSNEKILSLHKLFIQLSKDIRVLIIRIADRVDNIKTADGLPSDHQVWLAKKALHIHAPIAKSAGLYYFAKELEEEALKILDPKRYKSIKKFIEKKYKKIERNLILAKAEISQYLKGKDEQFEISFRTKNIYSIHKKTLEKEKTGKIKSADDFNCLYDLLGIRVLVENKETCYDVLAYIQSRWKIIQEEFDDYIAHPKPSGYQSIQVPVQLTQGHFCEIQIKTFRMHEVNEFGPASHFTYKYGNTREKTENSWIRDLIKLKDDIQNSIGENSAIELFKDTIFVFTPKNDLVTLPKDSTCLDFAYHIHSDIGNHCTIAKVNSKITCLDHILKSGDVIQITTSKNKKPNYKWLQFVKTPQARREIRKVLGFR